MYTTYKHFLRKYSCLNIPSGKLHSSDDAAKRKRKELAEKLRKGEKVKVGKDGNVTDAEYSSSRLHIPPGKLASFYWYDRDPDLLKEEKEAMKEHFPYFSYTFLPDGRFAWKGKVNTGILGYKLDWQLLVAYENNHPKKGSYGGSIKIYSLDPSLEDLREEIGSIPHLLTDSEGKLYLCTAELEDFKAGNEDEYVTSAASSIAWAIKWISVFELWLEGDINTSEFSGHTF